MKILVTGGAGFVGSNLCVELSRKHDVTALDNLKRRGSELTLPRLKSHGVRFAHGDIRNREDLDALGKVDAVVECSADASVLAGINSPPDYVVNTNLVGTVNCLEYARKTGADFIFLSTSRVYPLKVVNAVNFAETATRFEIARQQEMPGVSQKGYSEKMPLEGTRTLYGASKLASELIIQEYAGMFGMNAVINRCGVISGSWQMGRIDQGVVALWAASHFYKRPLNYIGFGGQGKQVRDVLNIKDLFKLVEVQLKGIAKHSGEVYNVGGGRENSTSLLELTQLCHKYTGNKVPVKGVRENRPGDIRIYITDNTKVTSQTGWKPSIPVEQTVKEMTKWIEENAETLKPVLGA